MVNTRSNLFTWVLCVSLAVGFTLSLFNVAGAAWEAELGGEPTSGKPLHRGPIFPSVSDLRDEGPFDDCPSCTRGAYFPFLQRIYPKPTTAIGAWLKPNPAYSDYGAQIDAWESMTQEHHGMYKLYIDWVNRYSPYQGRNWFSESHWPFCIQREADFIVENGSVPMVNWMPLHCNLDQINSGSEDWFIRAYAAEVRDWGHRILINWGHEMNIPEYPWSTPYPSKYRSAYRRIVTIFRQEEADNVEFVWSPNCKSHIYPDYNEYYPGDDYVDWVGADGYNWGSSASQGGYQWLTFDQIFGPILTDFSQRYPDKPQMVSETSCSPDDGGSKPQWITDAYASIENNYWMRLKAIFWFQESKEKDWRVESSPHPQSLEAYREAVDDIFFDGP